MGSFVDQYAYFITLVKDYIESSPMSGTPEAALVAPPETYKHLNPFSAAILAVRPLNTPGTIRHDSDFTNYLNSLPGC